jgi:hypothetical protein
MTDQRETAFILLCKYGLLFYYGARALVLLVMAA